MATRGRTNETFSYEIGKKTPCARRSNIALSSSGNWRSIHWGSSISRRAVGKYGLVGWAFRPSLGDADQKVINHLPNEMPSTLLFNTGIEPSEIKRDNLERRETKRKKSMWQKERLEGKRISYMVKEKKINGERERGW